MFWPSNKYQAYLFGGAIFWSLVGIGLCVTGVGFLFGASFLCFGLSHAFRYAAEKTNNPKARKAFSVLAAVTWAVSMVLNVAAVVNVVVNFLPFHWFFNGVFPPLVKVGVPLVGVVYCIIAGVLGTKMAAHTPPPIRTARTQRYLQDEPHPRHDIPRRAESPIPEEVLAASLRAASLRAESPIPEAVLAASLRDAYPPGSALSQVPCGREKPSIYRLFTRRSQNEIVEPIVKIKVIPFNKFLECYEAALEYLKKSGTVAENLLVLELLQKAGMSEFECGIICQLCEVPCTFSSNLTKQANGMVRASTYYNYDVLMQLNGKHPTNASTFTESDLLYDCEGARESRLHMLAVINTAYLFNFKMNDNDYSDENYQDLVIQRAFVDKVDTLHPKKAKAFKELQKIIAERVEPEPAPAPSASVDSKARFSGRASPSSRQGVSAAAVQLGQSSFAPPGARFGVV